MRQVGNTFGLENSLQKNGVGLCSSIWIITYSNLAFNMVPKKINVQEKFQLFSDHWNPRILTELNGQVVKAAKLKGDFVWHAHELEDELFYVISGKLEIQFRDGTIVLNAGEMLTIPKGIEHRPVAQEEVLVLLFEPASTVNTGDQPQSELTKQNLERL